MPRYAVIVVGEGVLLDESRSIPATGFVATRTIVAANPEQAVSLLRIRILQEWKQLFNRSNRAGTPSLSMPTIKRFYNPWRKFTMASDYCLFSDAAERDALLGRARQLLGERR